MVSKFLIELLALCIALKTIAGSNIVINDKRLYYINDMVNSSFIKIGRNIVYVLTVGIKIGAQEYEVFDYITVLYNEKVGPFQPYVLDVGRHYIVLFNIDQFFHHAQIYFCYSEDHSSKQIKYSEKIQISPLPTNPIHFYNYKNIGTLFTGHLDYEDYGKTVVIYLRYAPSTSIKIGMCFLNNECEEETCEGSSCIIKLFSRTITHIGRKIKMNNYETINQKFFIYIKYKEDGKSFTSYSLVISPYYVFDVTDCFLNGFTYKINQLETIKLVSYEIYKMNHLITEKDKFGVCDAQTNECTKNEENPNSKLLTTSKVSYSNKVQRSVISFSYKISLIGGTKTYQGENYFMLDHRYGKCWRIVSYAKIRVRVKSIETAENTYKIYGVSNRVLHDASLIANIDTGHEDNTELEETIEIPNNPALETAVTKEASLEKTNNEEASTIQPDQIGKPIGSEESETSREDTKESETLVADKDANNITSLETQSNNSLHDRMAAESLAGRQEPKNSNKDAPLTDDNPEETELNQPMTIEKPINTNQEELASVTIKIPESITPEQSEPSKPSELSEPSEPSDNSKNNIASVHENTENQPIRRKEQISKPKLIEQEQNRMPFSGENSDVNDNSFKQNSRNSESKNLAMTSISLITVGGVLFLAIFVIIMLMIRRKTVKF